METQNVQVLKFTKAEPEVDQKLLAMSAIVKARNNAEELLMGAPFGNQNAVGHGAPMGNQNAKGGGGSRGGGDKEAISRISNRIESLKKDLKEQKDYNKTHKTEKDKQDQKQIEHTIARYKGELKDEKSGKYADK